MTSAEFRQLLYNSLEEQQQNGIADILNKIKGSNLLYDRVKFKEIENSLTPIALSLLAEQLVTSTKALIGTITEPPLNNLDEYTRIVNKININRGVGTNEPLHDKTVEDLDENELRRLFKQERAIEELESVGLDVENTTPKKLLVGLSLAENGHIFKGTFLSLGKRNQIGTTVPTASESKFTHFKGINRNIILDMEDVKGCLIQQYEKMMQLMRAHIPLGRDRNTNEDKYELPMIAIREFLANAYVHRSYSQETNTFIQVELYDDRLEIKSPGSLPENLNLANIEGTQLINPTIMAVFHLYKYVEKRGSGIATAQEVLREYKLETAKIENIGSPQMVKVTIFRRQEQQLPQFDQETKVQIHTLINEYKLAEVFAVLDSLSIKDATYNRLKKEFMHGRFDIDFIDRFKVYINQILPPSPLNQIIDKTDLKSRIAKGKMVEVLEILYKVSNTPQQLDLHNDITLLMSRYNHNETEKQKSTIADSNYILERNRIVIAILNVIDSF